MVRSGIVRSESVGFPMKFVRGGQMAVAGVGGGREDCITFVAPFLCSAGCGKKYWKTEKTERRQRVYCPPAVSIYTVYQILGNVWGINLGGWVGEWVDLIQLCKHCVFSGTSLSLYWFSWVSDVTSLGQGSHSTWLTICLSHLSCFVETL